MRRGIGVLLFLIIIVAGGIVFLVINDESISEGELSSGKNLGNLKENSVVKFESNNEKHTLRIDSVYEDFVSITIQSDPTELQLKIGEEKFVDLDGDGNYDLSVKLLDIIDGQPELFVKKISVSVSESSGKNDESKNATGEIKGNVSDEITNKTNVSDEITNKTNSSGQINGNLSSNESLGCVTNSDCSIGYECENNSCIFQEVNESEYPVTNPNTILDCYNEDLSEILCSPEDSLAFGELFESRLSSCNASSGTFALGFEPAFGMFRSYGIQGEQNNSCSVEFSFLENSIINSQLPNLLNKTMICKYNSSQRTLQEVNDCLEDCCSGELVAEINEVLG